MSDDRPPLESMISTQSPVPPDTQWEHSVTRATWGLQEAQHTPCPL